MRVFSATRGGLRVKQFAGGGTPVWYRSHMKQPRVSDSDAFNAVEFELSAQDLLALSQPGALQGPTPDATHTGKHHRGLSAPRVRLSLSIVVAVVVTGVVLYLHSRPGAAVRSVMTMAPQAAAPLEQSSPTIASEQAAVRFANPFDHTEVFEFPPGTSEAEAREAVVEVLMKRAQDRQHRRNARTALDYGRSGGIASTLSINGHR